MSIGEGWTGALLERSFVTKQSRSLLPTQLTIRLMKSLSCCRGMNYTGQFLDYTGSVFKLVWHASYDLQRAAVIDT